MSSSCEPLLALVVGYLCIISICLVISAISLHYIFELFGPFLKQKIDKTKDCYIEDISDYFTGASWWFSEDTPTMKLLHDIGRDIRSNKSFRFNKEGIRNNWRQNIEIEKEK
jgi:hypothetical protein